ncbi:MAG: dimethylarginine dimethylaminohydrolase family protein [Candidatus Heimdallarchaeaceae archaeon]
MKANKAVVREPSKSYTDCVTSHPLGHTVSLDLAKEQHKEYCRTLRELGLDLIELPPKHDYPDACFVEDNAVVYGNKAFITRMGVESRRGEGDEVEDALKQYFKVAKAEEPATIEGGDVVHLPGSLICGISQRTNKLGVDQMRNWLNVQVDTIENPNIVHLKSYMKYLENNILITSKEYENHPLIKNLELLIVPKEEYYSINCLCVNETVIMSDKFQNAQQIVRKAGFEIISLNMSEFEKCQASLTCLSILF